MSKMRRNQKKGENQIAQTLKRRLVFLISFLSVSITVLVFRVGEELWPVGWLIIDRE